MAGRPVYLLIFLMPSPRFELRTLDGYSSYNVILRLVRAIIIVVEKQKVLHILSVCL
jgi:hypothetical protein